MDDRDCQLLFRELDTKPFDGVQWAKFYSNGWLWKLSNGNGNEKLLHAKLDTKPFNSVQWADFHSNGWLWKYSTKNGDEKLCDLYTKLEPKSFICV